MFRLNIFNTIIISLFLISCSGELQKKSVLKEKSLELQVLEVYKEGIKELEGGYALLAAKNLMKLKYYFHSQYGHPNHL